MTSRLTILMLVLLLSACQAAPASPTADMIGPAFTQAYETALAQLATAAPSGTPEPSPTALRTPPALPGLFQTPVLKAGGSPHTYIQDTCQALRDKWNPENSVPGTVVMVIMIHGISKDTPKQVYDTTVGDHQRLMNDLHDLGFQAINMQQMADFMERNARIPARSVLLIVDDRHYPEYFNDHFRPYYEQWSWPVVNAYVAKDERPDLWASMAALSAEGWVDYQSHGVVHNTNISAASTEEFMLGELQGAITNIQKYLNKTPIAYIWPGGGFTPRAAQLARQAGYRLGFTVNPRGPVMYNWVPLADSDTSGGVFIAEGPVNDPLMVLPRYWNTDAREHLDTVANLGEQAAAYAQQNKAVELEYYDIVCSAQYGAIH